MGYMEGPLDCGDDGWFCRIIPDPNWPPINLIGDLNFGHCNSTKSFDDAGYDKDGHCHGSSESNTYYWWIRDHFFRQYNGRVRCCCGWYDNMEDPTQSLFGGSYDNPKPRIANRCDYRRKVNQTENLNKCRDANEGHGLGFDDIGCDSSYLSQKGSPIPEDDGQCWEMGRFGYSENPPPPPPPEDCKQNDSDEFLLRLKKGKKEITRTCGWLEDKPPKKKRKICKKKTASTDNYKAPKDVCFKSCETGPCA